MATVEIPCLRCRSAAFVQEDAAEAACPTCGFALPPPHAAAWMVTRDGSQQFGPYTVAQLASYVAAGQVLASDGVWHQGADNWVPAGELVALSAGGQPAAAAPQPAAYDAYPQAGAAVAGPARPNRMWLHLRRALGWDLRSMPVEPDEHDRLVALSVDEEAARQYLVWRRSVLLVVLFPTLLSALLATLGTLTDGLEGLSALGVLLELLRLAALFVLPLTAWMAARCWDRHRRSRRILLQGWLVAFLTPLILALFPFAWRVDLSGGDETLVAQVGSLLALLGAISVYVTLMPAVLSLIPGVLRGCLRIKALLPESIMPGWFLIAAAPLYFLLFLVIFTTVNQLAGNLILLIAVFALLVAPLLYLFNAGTFTRPLRTPEEIAKIGSVQNMATIVVIVGLVLIVIYAFTATIMDKALIGLSESRSLLRPWSPQLFQFPLDYFVRSLFTTVVVADLFMLMNLSMWRHSKAFLETPEAESYDRLMSEIEEAGARA